MEMKKFLKDVIITFLKKASISQEEQGQLRKRVDKMEG